VKDAPRLLYHISPSSQGVFIRCQNCHAEGAWSVEFVPDTDTISHYLCAACGLYTVNASHVVETIYADPSIDSLMAQAGETLGETLGRMRDWAIRAGLEDEVQDLDMWRGTT
jgi:hypothetical protein